MFTIDEPKESSFLDNLETIQPLTKAVGISGTPGLLGSKTGGLKLELRQYVAVLEKQVSGLHETLQHLKRELGV